MIGFPDLLKVVHVADEAIGQFVILWDSLRARSFTKLTLKFVPSYAWYSFHYFPILSR